MLFLSVQEKVLVKLGLPVIPSASRERTDPMEVAEKGSGSC